jgi:hypothetical protein
VRTPLRGSAPDCKATAHFGRTPGIITSNSPRETNWKMLRLLQPNSSSLAAEMMPRWVLNHAFNERRHDADMSNPRIVVSSGEAKAHRICVGDVQCTVFDGRDSSTGSTAFAPNDLCWARLVYS